MRECDVLVVGGGPAGLSTAWGASKNGSEVICVEKEEEIGKPVKCAEGVGGYLLEKLPFEIPEHLLEWKIEGLMFITEDKKVKKEGDEWGGYSISRDKFDKWLASRAEERGVEILTESEFSNLKRSNGKIISSIKTIDGTMKIKSKYVVGADGVVSDVARSIGIESDREPGYIRSYEVENVNIESPRYEYLFLDEFSPNGYGYLFPKSKKVANLGVGDLFSKEGLEEKFDKFVNSSYMKEKVKGANFGVEKSGRGPFRNRHPIADGNVFFVGDSANQNIKPFIEGFLPAIICGHLLGENIGDLDRKSYKRLIEKELPELYESQKLQEPMVNIFRGNGKEKYQKLLKLMAFGTG